MDDQLLFNFLIASAVDRPVCTLFLSFIVVPVSSLPSSILPFSYILPMSGHDSSPFSFSWILTINLTLKILSDSIFTLYLPGISAGIGTGLGWIKKQLAILLNL